MMKSKGEIIIYQPFESSINLEVNISDENIWLSQKLMAQLFDKDSDTIGLHLKNIFSEGELQEKATTELFPVVQYEGKRKVTRKIKYYNLDAIISVGYRVNSKRGTQFRIWATKVLKDKLLENVTRQNREAGLSKVISYIARITEGRVLENEESVGLLQVITEYNHALEILDMYDHQQLEVKIDNRRTKKITIDEVRQIVAEMKEKYCGSSVFGVEKDNSLESSVSTIYQTFNRKELYPSPEIKAANLLYFMVKNHSFVDGNKRIAAAVFIYFMHKNRLLYNNYGIKVLDNPTLVALTLMLAESNPDDREMLVKVVVNLIQKKEADYS